MRRFAKAAAARANRSCDARHRGPFTGWVASRCLADSGIATRHRSEKHYAKTHHAEHEHGGGPSPCDLLKNTDEKRPACPAQVADELRHAGQT
jgi:hypothetical protein